MSQPDFIKRTNQAWHSMRTAFSPYSQKTLPPFDLLTEFVLHYNEKSSRAALCASAFFGEGMVQMPSETELRITWAEAPFLLRADRQSKVPENRYLTTLLLARCDHETIFKMRRHINAAYGSGGVPQSIPQFEMLYDLLKRETALTAADNARSAFDAIGSVANTMGAVCNFKIRFQ